MPGRGKRLHVSNTALFRESRPAASRQERLEVLEAALATARRLSAMKHRKTRVSR